MQENKTIKIFFNYFLGPLLFAWLVFSIYRQINNQPALEQSWQQIKASFSSANIWYLAGACVLIFINWGIEAWKWQLSVSSIQKVSLTVAYKAVLSGVTFSVSMPNRIGEYLGRVLYMPEGSRLKTISATLVGSFAQLLTTLMTGCIGLIALKKPILQAYPDLVIWYQFLLYGLLAIVAVLLLMYFNVAGTFFLFQRWIRLPKYLYLVEALRSFDRNLLIQILLLSLVRYSVFLIQYYFLFQLFGVAVNIAQVAGVMSVVFLLMTIIPSIALIELGVRGEISLRIMSVFSANSLGIGLTSITIWFINLMIPAILGSLLLLNLKVFGRKKERAEKSQMLAQETASIEN